jgi:predicted MFS family arabinose efflux permease
MIAFGGAGGSVGFVLVTLQPSAIIFPFAMLLMGAAFIMMHSTLQTRATELAPTARGTGIALFAFSLFLGSSLGAILTAMSLERIGYNETMLILAGIFAAFTATMTLTFRAITQPHYPDEHEQSVA